MLSLAALILDTGVKGWLENPAYLLGVPLLALGALGVLIALTPIELRWPQPQAEPDYEILPEPEGHPTATVYLRVGIVLAIITAVEVAFYYFNLADGVLLGVLMVLSAAKFLLVVMWFMHLRFDDRMFSIMFTGGMVLVIALFMIVLATLGASLV